MMTILWIIKFSVVVHLVLRSIFVGETDFVYKNIFWEFHLASEVDYYDTIKKNDNNNNWNFFCHNCFLICVSFLGSAKVSDNSEDTVSWLFY